MTSGQRFSQASAVRSKMRAARRQLLLALRSATLAISAAAFCWPTAAAMAQEKEPPRLFRGGLVQQLRSLTEDSGSSKTDAAPKSTPEERTKENPNIPRPRPVGEAPRGSTPTESRTANLRNSKQATAKPPATKPAATKPTAPTTGPTANATLGRFTDQPSQVAAPRGANEVISNRSAAIRSDAPKPNRPAELGVPVTNQKLANEARFQLNDKQDGASGYSANSKYDSAKSKEGAAVEDSGKVFTEPTKVQAVESMSQAPKVSRRPLPTGTRATPKETEQVAAPKSVDAPKRVATAPQLGPQQPTPQQPEAPIPNGLKTLGSTYSLEQTDAPEKDDSQSSAPEYPSLQVPAFAAPGAPHVKRNAPPNTTSNSQSQNQLPLNQLPQFPSPPANLNAPALPKPTATKSPETKAPAPKLPEQPTAPSLPNVPLPLPSVNSFAPPQSNSSAVPSPTFLPPPSANAPRTNLPSTQPSVPQMLPPSASPNNGLQNAPQNTAPRAMNPIRSNASAPAADEHMTMETPRLQVLLKGPHDMPVGTPAEYQVLVRNVDDIPLDGVMLRLEIPNGVAITQGKPTHGELETERTPDGATLVTWSFSDLAAYQNASAPMQLTAKAPRNFAVAMEWTLMPKSGEAQFDVRQARLELALEGPSEAEFGVANSYHLHVRNPGSAPAKNVKVKLGAASFGASETVIEEILPGEQQSIDVELTFNERGTININAEAFAAELKSAASIDVLVKQALVTAAITGSDRVYHGAPSTYEVRIQNSGDMDSKVVKAELAIPEGAEVLTKPDGASVMGHLLTWDVPNVKAGESVTFPVELNLWSAGEHRLALACKTERGAPSLSTIATVVEAIADLKLVINDPIAPAPVGGTVTYEMSITNRGSRAASNVRAVAQFSDGIEPTNADGTKHRIVTGQVIFEPIARIEAGETKVLRVQARASSEGTHRFRAEVRSDETEVRLVQEETTQYLESASRMARPINTGSVIR